MLAEPRNRTGQAVHIDLSQRELVTSMIGEAGVTAWEPRAVRPGEPRR